MRKKTIFIVLAAILGLALSAIPALGQNGQPESEPPAVCPFHDQGPTVVEEMDRWMDRGANHARMSSADHDRMRNSMEETHRMSGYGGDGGPPGGGAGHMMSGFE